MSIQITSQSRPVSTYLYRVTMTVTIRPRPKVFSPVTWTSATPTATMADRTERTDNGDASDDKVSRHIAVRQSNRMSE